LIRFVDRQLKEQLAVALLCNTEEVVDKTGVMVRQIAAIFGVKTAAVGNTVLAQMQMQVPLAGVPDPEYAGHYYSKEIDTTYEVVGPRDEFGRLQLLRTGYEPIKMSMGNGDHKFTINGFAKRALIDVWVTFRCDATRKCTELVLDDGSIPERAERLRSFPFQKKLP
jgi:hypothetical protein